MMPHKSLGDSGISLKASHPPPTPLWAVSPPPSSDTLSVLTVSPAPTEGCHDFSTLSFFLFFSFSCPTSRHGVIWKVGFLSFREGFPATFIHFLHFPSPLLLLLLLENTTVPSFLSHTKQGRFWVVTPKWGGKQRVSSWSKPLTRSEAYCPKKLTAVFHMEKFACSALHSCLALKYWGIRAATFIGHGLNFGMTR